MVIWLIGLAGAGKTTIGREVHARMKLVRPNVVFLDGDSVREIMGNDLGFSVEERRVNAWRICRLCRFLELQGIDVVCSILSIFHETQDWNRENYQQYFEVYIRVSEEVLRARDQKGLYSRAAAGEIRDVVGVDIPFLPPRRPDLILDNDNPVVAPSAQAKMILEAIGRKSA